MIPLICFLILALIVVVAIEWRERRRSRCVETHVNASPNNASKDSVSLNSASQNSETPSQTQPDSPLPTTYDLRPTTPDHKDISTDEPVVCCGTHLVCERETLLNASPEIVYYDDEELDVLSGISADGYTDEQHDMIAEVFHTLREEDVAGWVRSLQMRNISLPYDLRDEALLILREYRY